MRSCPNVQGVFGSRAVSGRFRAWRAGSARVSTPAGAQAVSWTRRLPQALHVWPACWDFAMTTTLGLGTGSSPTATARPGTERSRPMPTPPTGVYVAVMPVKSEPGAAPPRPRVASRSATRLATFRSKGSEPGPCGVPTPAEWCLVWCEPVLAHRPEMILVGMVTDLRAWSPVGSHVPQVT